MELWFPVWIASFFHAFVPMDSARILHEIDGLETVGRVLYVAAHPDDENTHMLAWLAHERRVEAAYLSLTRGDGGQNLIGTEQSDLLGVIRTWELLAARAQDGARQFIGTQRDFGYSKSSEEALRVWDDEVALRDVVHVYRTFRPHVVIARFPEQGATHGHHLASAQLARRAFAAAADPNAFPELGLPPWQAHRLYHNISTWNRDPDDVEPHWFRVDIGGWAPLTGLGHGEVASLSRSRHRSQGFGWAARRGAAWESLDLWEGDRPSGDDPLGGIDWSLDALEGSQAAVAQLARVRSGFDVRDPAASVPALVALHAALDALEDGEERRSLQAQTAELILAAAGVHAELRSPTPQAVPGATLEAELRWIARSPSGLVLRHVTLGGETHRTEASPEPRTLHTRTLPVRLPDRIEEDELLYWLQGARREGHWGIVDPARIGAPIGPPVVEARLEWELDGASFEVRRPLRHVHTDPVRGEVVRPVQLVPPLAVSTGPVATPLVGGSGRVVVQARAFVDVDGATVSLEGPEGVRVTPSEHRVRLAAGEPVELVFDVEAPVVGHPLQLRPRVRAGGFEGAWRVDAIDYEHMPELWVVRPSVVAVTPVELAPFEGRVGLIEGPGDLVGDALRAGGVDVAVVPRTPAGLGPLDAYRAVVVGVRAFNASPELHAELAPLFAWVERGGVAVIQYQTQSRIAPLRGAIAPRPVELDRGRVTDPAASVAWLAPGHAVFQGPNRLTPADFEGWIQERGLYFAQTWDDAWTPLLSMADPGEEAQAGALLVLPHGRGHVVYTGLSFFRQLPAGVPGAWRLFLNLLSLGAAP